MGANTHSNCTGGGGFAMGYNPTVDYGGTAPAKNGSSRGVSFCSLQFSITADQVIRRTVVFEHGCRLVLKFGNDSLGEHLAQLDAPLIERINVPNRALREYAVLVKRDQLAEHFRREPIGENDIGRTIAFKNAMWHKPVRRAFGFDFLRSFAKGQRLGLRKNIRQENVVVTSQRSERVRERNEVTGNQLRALMNQLIERVLAVGAGFAPINRPGLVSHFFPVERDVLAIALHRQLLKIRGKAFQVLFVGQNRRRLRAEEVIVPNR